MNLKYLTDDQLIKDTKRCVTQERKVMKEVLYHLREVERRKLYCDFGHGSMFSYCVKELGYAEGQAQRRIQAARLLEKMPELDKKFESGQMSLTNAALLEGHFRRQHGLGLGEEKKKKIVEQVSGKSSRECEDILLKLEGTKAPKIKQRVKKVNADEVRVSVVLPKRVMEKLEKIKGRVAHKKKDLAQMIELMADLYLKETDPAKGPERKVLPRGGKGRTIPAQVKREVYKRAGEKCENCGSQYALQIDHQRPWGMGGKSKIDNLGLLCRQCNLRAAINVYGGDKMQKFIGADSKVGR